jgi:hypothetical protein
MQETEVYLNDGQVGGDGTDHKESDILLETAQVTCSVFQGAPWFQDLDPEDQIKDWRDNNISVQPITNHKGEIVGSHTFLNKPYSELKKYLLDNFQYIIGLPVDGKESTFNPEKKTYEISDRDGNTTEKTITNIEESLEALFVSNPQLYYLIDLTSEEQYRRSPAVQGQIMLAILEQLEKSEFVIGQTITEGPLFDIIKDLAGFEIIESIDINDSNIKHILFYLPSIKILNENRYFKTLKNSNALRKRLATNNIIEAGNEQ